MSGPSRSSAPSRRSRRASASALAADRSSGHRPGPASDRAGRGATGLARRIEKPVPSAHHPTGRIRRRQRGEMPEHRRYRIVMRRMSCCTKPRTDGASDAAISFRRGCRMRRFGPQFPRLPPAGGPAQRTRCRNPVGRPGNPRRTATGRRSGTAVLLGARSSSWTTKPFALVNSSAHSPLAAYARSNSPRLCDGTRNSHRIAYTS